MSKQIKQMEMDALKQDFQGVRDLVVLSVKGMTCQADQTFRANLRKKNIRVKVIKNSLTRKVFGEIGLNVGDDSPYWVGPTTMVFGAGSVAELSQAVDGELKAPKTAPLYKDKVAIKGAVADGQPVPFDTALKMPTRQQAIARVLMLALAPASRIAGQIVGPAAAVASQIKTLSERKPEGASEPKPEEANATAPPA